MANSSTRVNGGHWVAVAHSLTPAGFPSATFPPPRQLRVRGQTVNPIDSEAWLLIARERPLPTFFSWLVSFWIVALILRGYGVPSKR
jgi:hypothetical protein